MLRINLVLLCTFIGVFGCAGVTIKPVRGTPEQVRESLIAANQDGYVIYHPMIVFEVVDKEVCKEKNKNGACQAFTVVCSLGTKQIVPDYDQAYVVRINSGFGKAGVDVTIADGWLLNNVKDNSDNTALLDVLFKAAFGGYKPSAETRFLENDFGCKERGLYRYKLINGKASICRIWSASQEKGIDCE